MTNPGNQLRFVPTIYCMYVKWNFKEEIQFNVFRKRNNQQKNFTNNNININFFSEKQ